MSTQLTMFSVLILTKNESLHISRCIHSAQSLTPHVFVVDSSSLDGTVGIASKLGVSLLTANFDNFSEKLNWCLDNIIFPTPWVIRLDADEVFTGKLLANLQDSLSRLHPEVDGVYLRRQLWFMGKWIRHGGMYPTYSMRLWRRGKIACEIRTLDEHMILHTGVSAKLDLDIIDNPLFSITKWIEKHNAYASMEAASVLNNSEVMALAVKPIFFGSWAERRRWLKVKIFYQIPLFVRPLLYFFYRYVIRFGFLDGRIGFIFHFMHGLWYRCLVDAKILEHTLDIHAIKALQSKDGE